MHQELAYKMGATDRKQKYVQNKAQACYRIKRCSAPQSQANTQQFALYLTLLSFRWTLPLSRFSPRSPRLTGPLKNIIFTEVLKGRHLYHPSQTTSPGLWCLFG